MAEAKSDNKPPDRLVDSSRAFVCLVLCFRYETPPPDDDTSSQRRVLLHTDSLPGATLSLSPNTVACAVSASNLRTKTLVLSRIASDATNLVQAAAGPYMLSVKYGNLQGYAAFPATAAVVLWITWAVFRLPKTDGIPQRIIDHLFQEGVSARRFGPEAERLQEWEASANREGGNDARDFDLHMVEQSIVQLGHDRG